MAKETKKGDVKCICTNITKHLSEQVVKTVNMS